MSTQIKTWEIIDSKLKEMNRSLIVKCKKEKQDLEELKQSSTDYKEADTKKYAGYLPPISQQIII